MRLEDYEKKVFEQFSGLWSRGTVDDVPEDHFSDCLNIDFELKSWKTRSGIYPAITLGYGFGEGKVRRFASFADSNLGPIVLILDDAGNLYTHSTRSDDESITPRLTDATATDFSAIKMFGRIYIAFHTGEFGTNNNLKVFIPGANPSLDEFRDAAGLAPDGTVMIAADGATGTVNAGVYKIAVSYVTSSGFVTQPGPKDTGVFSPTIYTAPGSKKINLSNIPIGPTGTVQRQILITKADLEEYFFLSSNFGGLIDNNTDTTAILDFDDTTDLIESADFLFDLLEVIPASLVLQDYNSRLVTGGELLNPSILRVSLPGQPEAFDAIDGIIFVSKDDGFTIRNMMVIRNNLYSLKNLGFFSITDNGDIPSTWKSNPVDLVVNASIHGIAEFFDISGIRMARDWTLFADKSGIVLFDGIVRKPPITEKINNIWQSINYSQYHKLVLVVDEQRHKIYCAIPTDFSTDNNKLLMGDYNSCPGKIPDASSIKWSLWQFNPCGDLRNPTELGLFGFPPDVVPTLKIGSIDGGGKIWSLSPFVDDDAGTDIESFWYTAQLFWEQGSIHFFNAARMRVTGYGTILCTIAGLDNVLTGTLPSIPLSVTSFSTFKFLSEYFRGDGVSNSFTLCNPVSGTFIAGFQNGLLIKKTVDYTVAGDVVTMINTPAIGDIIQFIYKFGNALTEFKLETPTGLINDVNTTFTLSATPSDTFIAGFQNGLAIKKNVDYTIVNAIITMAVAPATNDTLQFIFHSDALEPGLIIETPIEVPNGVITLFSLIGSINGSFIGVFQNGLLLRYITDYYLANNKVVFYNPPQTGDTLQFMYRSGVGLTAQTLGVERLIRFNFQNERARIKFQMLSGKFTASKLECYGKPIYEMRPA